MAALDFPASPTLNEVYSANGRSWIWNGTTWNPYGSGIADGDRGDITVSNNGSTWTVDGGAITYAKIQDVSAASKLLGRGDSGSGDVQEITLGTGLSMTGTTLAATGSGTGDVVGPASATDEAVARFDLTTGKLLQNSVVTITDAGIVAGATQLNVDNLRLDGNTLSSTDTNGNINLTPNGTGVVAASTIRASGSGGIALQNSGGTSLISLGGGGGVNASVAAPLNTGTDQVDYHQLAGGTGTITDTATGSSTNINVNIVPKGTGRLQAGGVTVPTISSSDTLTNKTLDSGTSVTSAISWGDGVRQTFNPDATNAGINVGSVAGDPSSPSNGDLWYDSTANELTARINGSNVALGAGSSGLQYEQLGSNVDITDNATFQNITGLSFSAAANTAYRIRFHMAVSTSATSTGYEIGINGPASPTGYFAIVSLWNSATAETASITNSTSYGSIGANANSGGGTARPCEGIILFRNGANAGTVNLQGKVETAVSGTVTFETGSFMTWEVVTT